MLAATAPPALIGAVFEDVVETRLGTPRTIAAGLLAGSVAMALADRRPVRRGLGDADWVDGLWLGMAQSCALVPGVSRNGATLAAARARGFGRTEANRLSRRVAFPVLVGASVRRLRRPGRGEALGGAAAFASTLVALRGLEWVDRDRPLAWWAAYRTAAAAVILALDVER